MTVSTQDFLKGSAVSIHYSSDNIEDIVDKQTPSSSRGLVIETADVAGVPEVPNPSDTDLDRLSRYIWKRKLASGTNLYYWDDSSVSDPTFLKWSALAGVDIVATSNFRTVKSVEIGLRGITGTSDGEVVFVQSYYEDFFVDMGLGGGFFRWIASSTWADDGGGTVIPSGHIGSGRWTRVSDRLVTPQMFGAKALGYDPTHVNFFDDTPAFEAALTFIHNSNTAYVNKIKTLFVPSGMNGLYQYAITSRIKLRWNTTVVGDGGNPLIKQYGEDHGIVCPQFEKWLGNPNTIWDWDHHQHIQGVRLQGTVDEFGFAKKNGKCGIGIYRPGETMAFDEVGCNNFDYGIWVVGGGAPGLQAKNILAHGNATAAILFTPLYASGEGQTFFLDNISTDIRDWLNPDACMFLFRQCVPHGYINGIKFEGICSNGIIRIELDSNNTDQNSLGYQLGYLDVEGINANCEAQTLWVDTEDIEGYLKGNALVVYDKYGGGSWPTNQNLNLPPVRLELSNTYALSSIIRDNINPDSDGLPYRIPANLYHTGGTGLTQGQSHVITYKAQKQAAYLNGYSRVFRSTNISHTEFVTPRIQTEGWYRIAAPYNGLTTLSGRFGLNDASNYLEFSVTINNVNEPIITVHNHSTSGSSPFKAIRAGWYWSGAPNEWSAGFIDVYIDPTNINSSFIEGTIGNVINIWHDGYLQRFHQHSNLLATFLVTTFTVDDLTYFLQTDLQKEYSNQNIINSFLDFRKSPIILGTKRLWFDGNNLRFYDSGVDVIPVAAGAGSGAELYASTKNGVVDSVRRLWAKGGNSYDIGTQLKIIPREFDWAGTTATVTPTISSGAISSVSVTSGGTNYSQLPVSSTSGRKILIEKLKPYGESIVCARLVDPNRQITIKLTNNSKFAEWVTGTTFDSILAAGDVLRYSGVSYRVIKILSTVLIELDTTYTGSTGNVVCDIVGYGIVPRETNYSVIPMSITAVSTGAISWSGTFTSLRVQTTGGTSVAEILEPDLGSSFASDMVDGGNLSFSNKAGMGDEFLSEGIEAVILNGENETIISAGSPIRIMLQGIKYKGQFVY